jgi:hypothetical protein
MTAITFPTNPANGSLYTAPNGAVYIWDGEKWMVNSTTYTGPALENITQDRVAPLFVNGNHTGITFAYNSETNTLTSTVTANGVSVNDFGVGFTDTLDSGKITTSKLYNKNPNQGLNNQYELAVTNGGVVALPDGSIINGATLKTVAGNYAGITAGPASPAGKDEDSWVWVDNNGATIATKYSTDAHTWTFNNDGDLTLPVGGDIKDSAGNSVLGGGEGLPTVTVPAETGTDYKGLQVSYGGFHSNSQTNTRNVTKVVIHKPAVTTTTITDNSNDDFFQVSGIGSSDILAMFVVIGDVNEAKPLSDIQAFAEEVIDTVILFEGTEGEFRTVDQMKAAFGAAYADLVTAVGGLATDFQFFESNINTLNSGVTTVREGSGAIFEIQDLGNGTYNGSGVVSGGINYLPGHKIKILGSALGGVDGVNDCIITVNSVDSEGILNWSVSGTAAGTELTPYGPVTGTNYQVGSGFTVASVYKYETYVNVNSYGTNYVVGDVITLLGANITGGTTPANNITITVNSIGGVGEAYGSTSSGTAPVVWRNNNINDGGNDEYDSGNYINSSYLNEIAYNGGNTVVNGAAAFGTGSSYSFVYRDSIFGLFVTGNSSTTIGTSGSGPDSGSTIISGNIYGPNIAAQTFDNAVSHINIIGDPYAGPLITFTRTDYGDEIDEISEGLHITKDDAGWLYNALEDEEHGDTTPTGSLWNNDGWDDFTNVESRTYTPLESIWGGNFANIPGAKMIMLDTTTDKYWAIEFLSWTNGQNGGGASYTRRELDLDSLVTGIRFPDGTRQTTAYVDNNVKLRSPGERRIEEVYGYKQVSVTSRNRTAITGATYTSVNAYELRVKKSTEINAFISPYYNTATTATWYISFDNVTFREAYINSDGGNNWMFYYNNANNPTLQVEDAPFYIRRDVGGDPVVWWDAADLPGGSSYFRGAIIKYHAYDNNAGTMVGTIYTVDDDGDENVTHTEVFSGGGDGDTMILWDQSQEGRLRARRTNGESTTIKIQWSATVFYGSEYWD